MDCLINNRKVLVPGNSAAIGLRLRRARRASGRRGRTLVLWVRYAATCAILILLLLNFSFAQQNVRQDISLNSNWQTIATDRGDNNATLAQMPSPNAAAWLSVNIPHNWDAYDGYRRLTHGNRHGDSWYRKTFAINQSKNGKRFFLFFEGVGSYATVYLNEKKVGEHAGGRTTFTIDVTNYIMTDGSNNQLTVRAYHPANIKDLPWVCGACSDERGFSEGSQPMGIFRPVHLIVTNDLRIEPFGIHAWADISDNAAQLQVNTTIKNYSAQKRDISILQQVVDANGKMVKEVSQQQLLLPNDSLDFLQRNIAIDQPILWSTAQPYLYKIISILKENDIVIDETTTGFGFRTISWRSASHQFFLNGKPVFINGIAEYEHQLGQSHAFSNEEIMSRINWVKMAGFNALRDAHQPHNLLYGQLCDKMGLLWWTQLSAHIWFDSPAFRNNFKTLLKQWVIERRNDPALVLWGLQNESKLPEDFAKECTVLIRQLDPTASSQRLVTTCNGGSGTDWDVPQNWTGTYGGDPDNYASEVKKQILIGEYGAWRTLDLHTEGGFVQNAALSEDRMKQLMEQKLRLATSVKDSSAGQFFWLLSSHDNPGRVQGGEGLRELDRIGPVNYKGLLTPWEEPTDAFYMFRSNYASKLKEPMVYIVSHTWPNRWMNAGIKSGITVYSNCDEVELFNDIDGISLGKRKRNGIGSHFQWDNVNIQYNTLYAVGYVDGRQVARDTILLLHLPASPHFKKLLSEKSSLIKPQPDYRYIYRINCGGADYRDANGNLWSADRALARSSEGQHGSVSWTEDFPGMPAFFASQRRTFDPIKGSNDWKLFQDFRYGKNKLQYEFPLPDGEYLIEFYFIEPWLGIGGGMNCKGMRLFDVAINNRTVLKDIDIWSEAGTNTALKKTVKATITGGKLFISFPQSIAGQAIISAIAIASLKNDISPAKSQSLVTDISNRQCRLSAWLDIGDRVFADANIVFHSLPPNLFGADWLQFSKQVADKTSFSLTEDADLFVGINKGITERPAWLKDYEDTKTIISTDENGGREYNLYRKRFSKGSVVELPAVNEALVMLLPVTNMQPAFDLKTVTSYRTNVAVGSEGIQKEMFGERECAIVKSNAKENIKWPVQTGVGDLYSITVKYFYPNEKGIKGKLQLLSADGTMMMDEPVNFTLTREGKWNQFTVNTGNMINAGNYTVRLMVEGAAGLAVSGIDVQ